MRTSKSTYLKVGVISLFPQMFDALSYGVTGRAIENSLLDLSLWDLREFSDDKHRTVDDRPYGGGPGMVLKTKPIRAALKAAKHKLGQDALCVYLSPQGKVIDQQKINNFMRSTKPVILLSGRYEGVDERVICSDIDEEWSVGDMVLSGGELAAMTIIDAMCRLIPGALGCEESKEQDSFMNGLLDHPHYTRPAQTDEGETIPSILSCGDHQAIKHWRLKQALGKTYFKRPDLLKKRKLSEIEKKLLTEYILEQN